MLETDPAPSAEAAVLDGPEAAVSDGPGATAPTAVHPAVPALVLALLAGVQIGLEVWVGGSVRWSALLAGRILPALLWVAATPVIMHLGRRWPVRGATATSDLLRHAGAFLLWFVATNVAIRIPTFGLAAWQPLLVDLRAGLVTYTPTSVLLWAVLAWLGGRPPEAPGRPAGEAPSMTEAVRTDGPAPSPIVPGETTEPDAVFMAPAGSSPRTLPIPGTNRIHLVPVDRIRRIEADGDHVQVHTLGGLHRTRGTLSDFERKLAGTASFVRIHRSHLVNVRHVREVQPLFHGDYVAVVSDGAELRIPRTRKKALARLLGRTPDRA